MGYRWSFIALALVTLMGLTLPLAVQAQVSLDGLLGGAADPAADTAAPETGPADTTQTDQAQTADIQEDASGTDGSSANEPTASPLEILSQYIDNLGEWENVANSAETLLSGGNASPFGLNNLRNQLFTWRDRFSGASDLNAPRVTTLEGQIAALGPVPETGDEPAEIATRRAELTDRLNSLKTPALFADEAYARADGLIAEVDRQLRAGDAQRLTKRGESPLNPMVWPQALSDGFKAIEYSIGSLFNGVATALWRERFAEQLPAGLLFAGIALVLLTRGRHWVSLLQDRVEGSAARGRAAWAFLLSLWQIIIPTVGLALLLQAFLQVGIFQTAGPELVPSVFFAGFVVIIARWLNAKLFPLGENGGPLDYPVETRLRIRRLGVGIGISVAVLFVMDRLLRDSGAAEPSITVLMAPVQLIAAYLMFRIGQTLRTAPTTQSSGSGGRRIVGLLTSAVAAATPLLVAAGFAAASDALFRPAAMTLAIGGVLIVLQRLVYDIYAPSENSDDAGPLMPVVIGFALIVASLPILALAWGARVNDLLEVWAQFRAGFAIGETRISPGDFVTFATIFAIGYGLTRFIQRSLKASVLPRTKLDLGGQNAVVSGFGYIGITLAALVSITLAGIDLSSLAIVAGALSVGIGFGLQTIVQNFVSGIILLIERPIGEGDMIEVNGQVGFVRDISVRSTRIETFDRTDVIIPNADLVSGQVTNWTRGNAVGRLILPVGVAYGTDVEQVRAILLEIGEAHPLVLADPPAQALFVNFGASSLDFELRMILRDVNWKLIATDEMNREINRRFAEAGIEIPFAQQDIWLRNPETLRAGSGPNAQKTQRQGPQAEEVKPSKEQAGQMLRADDLSDDDAGDADGGDGVAT